MDTDEAAAHEVVEEGQQLLRPTTHAREPGRRENVLVNIAPGVGGARERDGLIATSRCVVTATGHGTDSQQICLHDTFVG